MSERTTAIVGGGAFGCFLAALCAERRGGRVVLIEQEGDILQRASLNNQARVHKGYHYPRSLTTGLRCAANYRRFIESFGGEKGVVADKFIQHYAIARRQSKITTAQFKKFCALIGAPLYAADARMTRLANTDLIDSLFAVEECAFDAVALQQALRKQLDRPEIDLRLSTKAQKIIRNRTAGALEIETDRDAVRADEVFLCLYAGTNAFLERCGIAKVPLMQEVAELALVAPPDIFGEAGLTVMDGDFFSLMPFPARQAHSFSHVRYTPHMKWQESDAGPVLRPDLSQALKSRYPMMIQDACRYFPVLKEMTHRGSVYEVKTLLPSSARDDGRPILLRRDHGLTGLNIVIGGKIDNMFDIGDFIFGSTACP